MPAIKKLKDLSELEKPSRVGLLIMAEAAAGVVMALLSLWVFVDIADEVVEKETAAIDTAIQGAVYSLRNPELTQIMAAFSFLGSKEFLFAVSIAVIAVFCAKKRRRAAMTYGLILLLSAALNNLIKFAIRRDRPDFLPLEQTFFYSFPSGHSMNSLVFYGLLAYFVFHYTRSKSLGIAAYGAAAAIVIMIGVSRIYLGAHYPTDVLAGFVAGICVLSTAIAIDKTLKFNRILKEVKNGNY